MISTISNAFRLLRVWTRSRPLATRAAVLVAASAAAYFWYVEGWNDHALVAMLVLMTLGAVLVFITRRLLLSALVVAVMVAGLYVLSFTKQAATGITLHSYDIITAVIDPTNDGGLWSWANAYAIVGTMILATAIWCIVYLLDRTRVWRPHAALAALTLIVLVIAVVHLRSERRHTEFVFEDHHLSSFIASWGETAAALRQGSLLAAGTSGAAKLAVPDTCAPTDKPPHILLIHQESVVPPALFPGLSYDRGLDDLFRSHDGRTRKLRVETFGGGSWLTEFSVLTGVPSSDFGGLRHMAQSLMAGKMREALPQVLARCGYRRIAIYPMLDIFMSIGRFFRSVGIDEVFDAKAQKAKRANERDRFYYDNLLEIIARHTASASPAPLFAYVETMAAHGSYDYAYDEEVEMPGGGPGTHPDVHEYLRRLGMVRMDYDYLRSELARRFPDQPFLIVHYGDHQPTAASTLLGFPADASVEQVLAGRNPLSLMSYYAVDAIGYAPPTLPDFDTLDVPYIGTIVLQAARLPLSDTYRERQRLMTVCNGIYRDCSRRKEILRFHRRLIDSGIVGRL